MTYSDDNFAQTHSPVYISDVRLLIRQGRELCDCFDEGDMESCTGFPENTQEVFSDFHASLYGSGFVMGDFDGPSFGNGPLTLFFARDIAPQLVARSNLLTLRMFAHTLARGYRFVWSGWGYPYFDNAYKSGALRAFCERLDVLCDEGAYGSGILENQA